MRYPGDTVIFAEAVSMPRVAMVMRLAEDRASNPDRLALDGRALTRCPHIEGDHQLRMLHLQGNQIRQIEVDFVFVCCGLDADLLLSVADSRICSQCAT